jgi:hypothetical protein
MRFRLLAIITVLSLLFGCMGQTQEGLPQKTDHQSSNRTLDLAYTGPDYIATYSINENGEDAGTKTVYRRGGKARVDVAGGAALASIYFIDRKAYSCGGTANGSCFDITDSVPSGIEKILGEAPSPDAAYDGRVDIGGVNGDCYLQFIPPSSTRRTCYAPQGILAYDEYNSTAGTRVEYALNIDYFAPAVDFELPFEVKGAPPG